MGFAYPTSFPIDEAQGCADFLAGVQTDPYQAQHDAWAVEGYVQSQQQANQTPIGGSVTPCSPSDAQKHLKTAIADHKGARAFGPIPWPEILAALDAAIQSLLGTMPATTPAPAGKKAKP